MTCLSRKDKCPILWVRTSVELNLHPPVLGRPRHSGPTPAPDTDDTDTRLSQTSPFLGLYRRITSNKEKEYSRLFTRRHHCTFTGVYVRP